MLALSHISSTSALYHKRATGSPTSLYAYGTNISGVNVFYGDGGYSTSAAIFGLAIKSW